MEKNAVTRFRPCHEQPECAKVAIILTPIGVMYLRCDNVNVGAHALLFTRGTTHGDWVVAQVPAETPYYLVDAAETYVLSEEDIFQETINREQRQRIYQQRYQRIVEDGNGEDT